MSKLPVWARKPNHKKSVVATDRGWVVQETGEILRSVSDLPVKLKELFAEAEQIPNILKDSENTSKVVKPEPIVTYNETDQVEQNETGEVPDQDEQQDQPKYKTTDKTAPKKRGPKPKNKNVVQNESEQG